MRNKFPVVLNGDKVLCLISYQQQYCKAMSKGKEKNGGESTCHRGRLGGVIWEGNWKHWWWEEDTGKGISVGTSYSWNLTMNKFIIFNSWYIFFKKSSLSYFLFLMLFIILRKFVISFSRAVLGTFTWHQH